MSTPFQVLGSSQQSICVLNIEYPTRNLEVRSIFIFQYPNILTSGGFVVLRFGIDLIENTEQIKSQFLGVWCGTLQ